MVAERKGPKAVALDGAAVDDAQRAAEEAAADALVEQIRRSVIGDDVVLDGPFGPTRMVYADYTASGRSLSFLEEFLRNEVMPLYANTHTESSGTGLQTSALREDAREIIHRAVGAGDDDVVIFCGSGATGAIDKMVRALGLVVSQDADARWNLIEKIPAAERPVVFIGPYEHHSNEILWRYSIADTVEIEEDSDGRIDLQDLERRLVEYADRPLKIGSFSAGSNVTGILSDTEAIAKLLHAHGALSFWDYAAAAPYVPIDMNPGDGAHMDAIFISPHKFIGGPGTPGVLVAKRSLFRNRVPTIPGGGTVAWVASNRERFLDDVAVREEGGTPAIVESIRAGLVFQLKDAVGPERIRAREHGFVRRAITSWGDNDNLWILGNPELERLSIVSLVARWHDKYLHWNFIVALLNDLFGIQSRGGCSCAGPYGHRLYGIDDELSEALEDQVACGLHGIKPGWFRVNFNYFISDTVFDYIVDAVHFAADEGWKLLPYYRFDPRTTIWHHRDERPADVLRLDDLRYGGGGLAFERARRTEPEGALPGYLDRARAIVAEAERAVVDLDPADDAFNEDFERLRWFPTAREVIERLRNER
jgi:selenocysteine lyase/cysteine desulfurase